MILFGCNQKKIKSNIDKSLFIPQNYRGYGYIYINDVNFIDNGHFVQFIPFGINKLEFLKSNYKDALNRSPIIKMRIDTDKYLRFKNNNNGYIDIKDTFCEVNTKFFKWARIYIEYSNFEEIIQYDQSIGEPPYKELKQSNKCFNVILNNSTDSSIIKKFKIITNSHSSPSPTPRTSTEGKSVK